MLIKTRGIVIAEKPFGESGKQLRVLTVDRGLIHVSAKGAYKLTTSFSKSTHLFAFSTFYLYEKNGFYTLTESALIDNFFSLRDELELFALASYFCEVATVVTIDEGGEENPVLSLLLNSLYALSKKQLKPIFIKAVFEIRMCAVLGLEPIVDCCPYCDRDLIDCDTYYINFSDGAFYCGNCVDECEEAPFPVSLSVLKSFRHCINSVSKSIFSFKISDEVVLEFSLCAEKYMLLHLEQDFKTLHFYKKTIENIC